MTAITPNTIEYWAQEKTQSVALVDGEKSLTYAEWNEAADRVAEGLAAHGVQLGDTVVLRTQIRHEWAILASALAKLGCSLLGLNWRLTPSETKYVIDNSGATVFICDDPDPSLLTPVFAGLNIKLAVSIDTPATGFVSLQDLMSFPASPRFSKGNPPLIIYTSGTTGLPKGVDMRWVSAAGTDRKMAEYLDDIAASRPQLQGEVVLITLPMHHGVGPYSIWRALRLGNKAVLLRRFTPTETLSLIERHKVTSWQAVPTMHKRIAALPQMELEKYDVSSLRFLGIGAAPVPHVLKEWVEGYFGLELSEGYGSTETDVISYVPKGMHRVKPGTSGILYKHVDVRIRDENGVDLPTGVDGEIWARTPATIDRYLDGKPLGPDTLDNEGFFRVGDIGRLDQDGYLFITDRAKDMVVSGGVNIYPAEIEAALLRHPAVQDAAVIGIPDDEFGEQVKAFIELKAGMSAAADDIVEHTKTHLASYKRPRSVEIVTELPRNTMGKLLKKELREPFWRGRERRV